MTVTFRPESDDLHVGMQLLDLYRSWATDRTGKAVPVVAEDCSGMRGYEHAIRLYAVLPLDDGTAPVMVGRIDWGGAFHRGRARFDLSGKGCSLIANWHAVRDEIEDWLEAKITRVDLAVDCLNGEYTVEDARDWFRAGEFNAGGRMPRHSCPGDWQSDQPYWGRTLEIGRRENGKMCRAYEKGRQLGDPDSTWTRFEVEIRNIDRDIPLDVLTDRDVYFAGAYKCLQQLLEVAGERIETHQVAAEISAKRLVEACSVSYGKLFNVLRLSLTAEQIFSLMGRPGMPARLDKATLADLSNLVTAPPVFQELGNEQHG